MADTTKLAPTSLLDRIRSGDVKAARDAGFAALAQIAQSDSSELTDQVLDIRDTGEGYVVVPTSLKSKLIGVPFFIVDVDMNVSKKVKGSYFVTLNIVTEHAVHEIKAGCTTFILNDGGSGIARQVYATRDQLGGWPAFKERLPMLCPKGLRSSTYTVTEDEVDDNGNFVYDEQTGKPNQVPVLNPLTKEEVQGTTFYLDESV